MITAIRAPTSHAGIAAGITIFRTVVTGPRRSIRATSYCRGCTAATPPAVCSTIGHSAAYAGERDLGRPNRPERQDRDRHQRNGWNRAQEIDRRHRVAPHRRYQANGQSECRADRHADRRRHDRDAERVRDVVDEFATAHQIQDSGQHFAWRRQVLVVEQAHRLERLPARHSGERHDDSDQSASHPRLAGPVRADGGPAGSGAARGSPIGRADGGVRCRPRR